MRALRLTGPGRASITRARPGPDSKLSKTEKVEALDTWEQGARQLMTARVLDCTKYGANESSFVMAEQTSTFLVRDVSRRQWCRRRFWRRFRSVVGAVRDGECLGVAMSPKGA